MATENYSIGLQYEVNEEGNYCTVTGIGTCTDTEIVIPATYEGYDVREVGKQAFASTNLTSITIPSSVTSIGEGAFSGCTQLQRITLDHPVNSIKGSVWGAPEDVQIAWIGVTGAENVDFYFLNDVDTPCPTHGAISFGVEVIADSEGNAVSVGDDGVMYVTDITGPHTVGTFDAAKIRFKDALAFTENFGKYKPNGKLETYEETKGMSVQEFITSALTSYSIKSEPRLTASISPSSARYGTTQNYNLRLTFTQGEYSTGDSSKCEVESIVIEGGNKLPLSYKEYIDGLTENGSTTIPLEAVSLLDDLSYNCTVTYTADKTGGVVEGVRIPRGTATATTSISCYSGCLIYTTTEDLASDTAAIVQQVINDAQLKSKSDNPPESYKISNSWKHLCVLVPTATSNAANWNPLDTDGNSPLPQTVRQESVQVPSGNDYNNSSEQISYTLFISSNASNYNSCTVKFNWSK